MHVPQTCRAYQFDNYGPQETELHLRESVARPALGPKHVRIKVVSAAVNPCDYMILEIEGEMLTGKKPTPEQPFGMGFDCAGIVAEVGSEAKRLKVGDQVYAMTTYACGTFADFVVLDEDLVALKPDSLTFNQAASLPLAAMTSFQALVEHADLKKGERVLILGGSSAVGLMAIQLAHAIGAYVIATTSAKNATFVKDLGADQVVDYHTQKWVNELENHSVDVIYDCGMEADAWNTDAQLALKKETGRFVTLLPITQPVQPAKFGAKNLGFIVTRPNANTLDSITEFVEKRELMPVIDSLYSFEEMPKALMKLKGRHARGKLIIQVNDAL